MQAGKKKPPGGFDRQAGNKLKLLWVAVLLGLGLRLGLGLLLRCAVCILRRIVYLRLRCNRCGCGIRFFGGGGEHIGTAVTLRLYFVIDLNYIFDQQYHHHQEFISNADNDGA